MKSSRLVVFFLTIYFVNFFKVTVVFDPEQTVRQALLQIAKKPQGIIYLSLHDNIKLVALDVDDALHNYEIFIPNKSGGITMSNDKKLSFYNLNDKVNFFFKLIYIIIKKGYSYFKKKIIKF